MVKVSEIIFELAESESDASEIEKSRQPGPRNGQLPMDTFRGDPLHDLPNAVEGGAAVAILKEDVGKLEELMNRYDISGGQTKRQRQSGGPESLSFHAVWTWIVEQWEYAVDLSNSSELTRNAALEAIASEDGNRSLSKEVEKTIHGNFTGVWSLFRETCKNIEKSVLFQNFFGVLIVVNTVLMGFQVDNGWKGSGQEACDHLFVTLFVLELVVRYSASDNAFIDDGFLHFDGAIVFVSVLDKWVLPVVLRFHSDIDLRLIHVFRVCRIVRLARLLRIAAFLKPLRVMERSLRRGVMNWITVMIFLLAYFYAFSLILKFLVGQSVLGSTEENFTGSVVRLMIFLFEAMLSGFDWVDKIAMPMLEERSTRFAGVCFVVFMFCTKLALANIITSSMVENYLTTMSLDTKQMEFEELSAVLDVKGMTELLHEVDDVSDNLISWTEFTNFTLSHKNGPKLLSLLGIKPLVDQGDPREVSNQLLEMRKVFEVLDVANEEQIPIEVFVLGYVKLKGSKKQLSGLITDYMLKQVLVMARHQTNVVAPMEWQMDRVNSLVDDQLHHLTCVQIDIEDIVQPADETLTKLEHTFAMLTKSLTFPTDDADEVPAACASLAALVLQAEMEALRKTTEDFMKSQSPVKRAHAVRALVR